MANEPRKRFRRLKSEVLNDPNRPEFRTLYVGLCPSTPRYHRLLELSEQFNCSYHSIALTAIDWYLNTQVPPKK